MGFMDYRYMPILGVRPAEMRALEELAANVKDTMLPYIALQPWLAANELASAVARINAAVGLRPIIADISEALPIQGKRRPVHDAFDLLRSSTNGYKHYIDFVSQNENFLPALQLTDLTELDHQIARLIDLDRNITIRLHEPMLQFAGNIAEKFAGTMGSNRFHFVLDFEKQNRDILVKSAISLQTIGNIRAHLPDCSVSVSASTFPESFVGLSHQDIFERRLHAVVKDALEDENLVYCDRGSARAEPLGGGGGTPAPRIDLANIERWHFFRVDDSSDKHEGFRRAANNAMDANCWIDLGVWGTEYIKRTGDEDETDVIDTAAKCTAARINIHLHTQATEGTQDDGTEEIGWSD